MRRPPSHWPADCVSTFRVIHSRDELRDKLAVINVDALVFDLEFSKLTDVERLRADFPALPIICTHRVPDEEMWMAALRAGASDMCRADDVESILASILNNIGSSRQAAA